MYTHNSFLKCKAYTLLYSCLTSLVLQILVQIEACGTTNCKEYNIMIMLILFCSTSRIYIRSSSSISLEACFLVLLINGVVAVSILDAFIESKAVI